MCHISDTPGKNIHRAADKAAHPKFLYKFLGLFALLMLPILQLNAHNLEQVVLTDSDRIELLLEDAETIKKAISQVERLSNQPDPQARNQLVRWIQTKDAHAQEIIETIAQYFIVKRIHPDQPDYAQRIAQHHTILILADKLKDQPSEQDADVLIRSIRAIHHYHVGNQHHHH